MTTSGGHKILSRPASASWQRGCVRAFIRFERASVFARRFDQAVEMMNRPIDDDAL
jgi:hypothetical protein